MIWHLRISGGLFVILGFAHVGFGKRLNWREDLAKLSVVNRQIFVLHSFYIALLLVMLGSLLLFLTDALLQPSPLSKALLGAMTLLWTIRFGVQWLFFERSIWEGHAANRRIHYLLMLFWAYVALVDAFAFARVISITV